MSGRWTSDENQFLMRSAYRVPWGTIAAKLGRTEMACRAHYEKIMRLRKSVGTWKGL